jgi:hypothetical protein
MGSDLRRTLCITSAVKLHIHRRDDCVNWGDICSFWRKYRIVLLLFSLFLNNEVIVVISTWWNSVWYGTSSCAFWHVWRIGICAIRGAVLIMLSYGVRAASEMVARVPSIECIAWEKELLLSSSPPPPPPPPAEVSCPILYLALCYL